MTERVRQKVAGSGLAGLLLVTAACGTQGPRDMATPGNESQATVSSPAPWDPETGGEPPGAVILHRTGGIAGFADKLVVAPDGAATLSSKGKEPVACTVDPALLAELTALTRDLEPPQLDPDFSHTTYPDKLDTFITYGKTRVQYDQLAAGEDGWRALFPLLNTILSACVP